MNKYVFMFFYLKDYLRFSISFERFYDCLIWFRVKKKYEWIYRIVIKDKRKLLKNLFFGEF